MPTEYPRFADGGHPPVEGITRLLTQPQSGPAQPRLLPAPVGQCGRGRVNHPLRGRRCNGEDISVLHKNELIWPRRSSDALNYIN